MRILIWAEKEVHPSHPAAQGWSHPRSDSLPRRASARRPCRSARHHRTSRAPQRRRAGGPRYGGDARRYTDYL